MINKNIIKRNEILETVKEHHFAMRSLIKLLGLSENFSIQQYQVGHGCAYGGALMGLKLMKKI